MPANRRAHTISALAALLMLWVAFVVLSVQFCGNGFIHPEIYGFIPHYLTPRPVLALIYDHIGTNWGTYQAREMSHLFDWIDVQFIARSVEAGRPHFFSFTHYVFLLVAGVATWRIANRYFRLGHVLSVGLALLLWTTPTAFLYTSYYRTAKVGLCLVSLLFVWACCYAEETSRKRGRPSLSAVVGLWLSGICMPMFDKQGLLFLIAAVGFFALRALARPLAGSWAVFGVGCAALGFAFLYNYVLDPWLTEHLLGYRPSFDYQRFPASALFSNPKHLGTVAVGAPLFALDSLRFLAGNLPLGLLLVGLLGVHWLLQRAYSEQAAEGPRWFSPAHVHIGAWICITGIFALLLIWLPALFSNEHRRFFYNLPVTSFWLVLLMSIASASLKVWPNSAKWLIVLIGALVLSNMAALPEHRFVLRHGKYRPFLENATMLLTVLQPSKVTAQGITPEEAAALLKTAPYFRDAVPPSLREDRIFLLFLAKKTAQRDGHPESGL